MYVVQLFIVLEFVFNPAFVVSYSVRSKYHVGNPGIRGLETLSPIYNEFCVKPSKSLWLFNKNYKYMFLYILLLEEGF